MTHSPIKRNVLQHKINKKLKPGLVASFDIRPGNGDGLFWFQCFTNLSIADLLKTLTYLQPRHTRGPTFHKNPPETFGSYPVCKQTKFSPVRDWRSTPLEWLSITHDLDLASGHTAHGRASLIDLYLHTKFHWNQKNFFCGRTNCRDRTKFKVTWHKTRTNIENPARSNLDIVL